MITNTAGNPGPSWISELSQYSISHTGKALWQLVNTIIPYLFLWGLMAALMLNGYSYWLVLGLSLPAAGFMVRTFILFHDCCHGSFFKSRKANKIGGYITGLLTFTPFEEWRRAHNMHHATSGDLDHRGVGDVWTMTLKEYQSAGKGKRIGYRLFRHPLVMFGLGPIYLFLISNRVAHRDSKSAEIRSVWITNVSLIVVATGISSQIGFTNYLLIQLPILFFAGALGIWLFFVQHQYEEAYWTNNENWNLLNSALNGSSYYKLPRFLQWISGNIGFHHIHHLRPRIPNYHLQTCNENVGALKKIPPLTLKKSLRSLGLHLWDEEQQKLVSFGSVKRKLKQAA